MPAFLKNQKFKIGFTLAEVLLTLAVIGVIAALTIPTLMKNWQNAAAASAVKKFHSLVNQAVKSYSVENDCVGDLSACGAFEGNDKHLQAWTALKPYFKIIKDCGSDEEGCIASEPYSHLNAPFKTNYNDYTYGKGILSDGTFIMIDDRGGNCSQDSSKSEPPNETPLEYVCAFFYADINGAKGPNQLGRDLFIWDITKSGAVLPYGALDDHNFTSDKIADKCDPDRSDIGRYGLGCAARILHEGKINY